MTIGVGILASDGVVIAGNSQISTEIKWMHGKVTGMFKRDVDPWPDGTALISHPGGLAITVAGQPLAYPIRAAEVIRACFESQTDLTGDSLKLQFEGVLRDFHDTFAAPYLGLPQQERPAFDLLIGVSRDNRDSLWCCENGFAILHPYSPYHAIGSGATQAEPLLQRLYRLPFMDTAQTMVMAAFVVHQVKQTNLWCGKITDVVGAAHNHMFVVPRPITKQLDEAFDDHEDILAALALWAGLGAHSTESEAAYRKARRDIRSLVEMIRRDCLLERL